MVVKIYLIMPLSEIDVIKLNFVLPYNQPFIMPANKIKVSV